MKSLKIVLLNLCLFIAGGEALYTQCGNIFTDDQFVLTSENYPLPYPTDKECFYLLKGGNCTTHFNIEFLDFNLANSVGCVKDRLEIGSQDALCGTRNGSKVYINERGSLKLKFVSDNDPEKNNRGFRLLVTRVGGCGPIDSTTDEDFTPQNRINTQDATETIPLDWTTKTTNQKPNPSYLPPKSQPCCQNTIYSSNKFLLVSPNFLFTLNAPKDCTYTIRKSSPLVCRLRINVLFFALGLPGTNSCPHGHLELDGKYICGCNFDLQLITSFGASETKVLKLYSPGYNGNDISGFVLEIIQDECQKRYSPDVDVAKKFRYFNDQLNRVKWPSNNNINQLKLVKERNYYLPSKSNEVDSHFGDIYKHFYFFAPEDEGDTSWTQTNQEKEETNYVDVSTIDTLMTNQFNYQQCRDWNSNQLRVLQERFGNSLHQTCQGSQQTSDCLVLGSSTGRFNTPGYPLGYPLNGNFCYRFKMLPGYCSVQVFFEDFQVESSYDCLKDYLEINQYRYCGDYLSKKQVTIITNEKPNQDLKFVSDVNNVERGFSATYQQVRCQKLVDDDSIRPINPGPGGKAADDDNLINCGKVIADKHFIIRNGHSANSCVYTIARSSMHVCKLKLYFDCFYLPCEIGSLTINNQIYCGERTGESVTVDILDTRDLVLQQKGLHYFAGNTEISIRGEQIDTDCDSATPRAVRLISTISSNPNETKLDYSYTDVCELIKQNITTKELPHKICEILTKNHHITECNFSKAVVLEVPETNSTTIQLLNDYPEKFVHKDITCQSTPTRFQQPPEVVRLTTNVGRWRFQVIKSPNYTSVEFTRDLGQLKSNQELSVLKINSGNLLDGAHL